MSKSAVVILPTTVSPELFVALTALSNQTYDNLKVLLVIDGDNFKVVPEILHHRFPTLNLEVVQLISNVGANGFYGHRIIAGFSHLVNEDYVLFLDQDCWYEPTHVESMINNIETNNLDWSYSLRNICDKSGDFICVDNCESLGKWNPFVDYNHIDTNCYCINREILIQVAHAFHGGWGADRRFYYTLSQFFPNYDTTGEFTVNYRLGGNEGSVKPEFFLYGNKVVENKFSGNQFPWRKI